MALISCPVFEVFFGGSRGSLKTESVLADWINHAGKYGEDAAGLMVRRTREQLKSTIARARAMYIPLGFHFRRNDTECISTSGARLVFAYLDKDSDAENYQGWNLTRVYVEELGNFASAAPVLKLMATLRSPAGVPCGFRGTGNPGGPGQQWVKERYQPNVLDWQVRKFEYRNPWTDEVVTRDRIFIPGRITDHNLLGPEYIANLQMSGSTQLVKAWLLGDWDAVEGAFFDNWNSAKHVIKPCLLPKHWMRFRSGDWGSARPFSFSWWAVASEDYIHSDGFVIPKGAMINYREWYGVRRNPATGDIEPNVGVKLSAEAVGAELRRRDGSDEITYGVLDPSAFASDGGPSIAERIYKGKPETSKSSAEPGVLFRRADNKRVASVGRMGGWDQLRARLEGEDMRPMIYFFNTCSAAARTIPALQHDDIKIEDLDTEAEDHKADDVRYACMSRPYARPKPGSVPPIDDMSALTINRLWKEAGKQREERI